MGSCETGRWAWSPMWGGAGAGGHGWHVQNKHAGWGHGLHVNLMSVRGEGGTHPEIPP